MGATAFDVNYPTHKYALDLVARRITAGKKEIQAAKIHIKNLERQGKNYDFVFDHTKADRFFKFYEMCFDVERNEYFKLLPHHYFDFGLQFGWVHKETGNYKHTRCYKQQSRGNCKTTECAIKAPYKLIGERKYKPFDVDNYQTVHNARIYLMAVDKTQVEELREPIMSIAKHSPKLKPYINARSTYIRGAKFGGQIVVMSKDLRNKQGAKPDYAIVDELSSHIDGKRLSALEKGFGKKEQAQLDIITTAGDMLETNPAKVEYDYAKRVLNGDVRDERYLAIIREQDEDDDVSDTKLWAKSNPMLRYLGKEKYASTLFEAIQNEYRRAFENNDLEAQRQFKIYRMNLWQEGAVNSYLKSHEIKLFEECKVSKEEFNRLVRDKSCIAGLDFSIRRADLTAVGFVWQLDDGRFAIDGFGYMPVISMIKKETVDRVPYSDWAKAGWLETTHYPMPNSEEFANIICKRIKERSCTIKEITYDSFHAYDAVTGFIDGKFDTLGAGTFSESNVIEVPQNVRTLHIPTIKLRDEIIQKNIVWNGNPLLKWCFVNAYEFKTQTGDLIKVMKENKTSNKRIDLLAAIINAFVRWESLKIDTWVDRMATAVDFF